MTKNKNMKIILVSLIALFNAQFSLQTQIFLDPKYFLQNLLIFVKDDVPEGNGTLLENIKKYISETSRSLLKATSYMDQNKAGVQFGKVSIVIPQKWTAISDETITWQQCNKADILITTKRENQNQDEPFTKQIGKCGEPAESIRISHSFMISTEEDKIRIQGKKIMTEFAKLRYGVFSEKPYRNRLIVYDGNRFHQSSCADDIKWTLSDTRFKCSDSDNKCTYSIDSNQMSDFSVMFDQTSNSTEYFCDDHDRPHNAHAASLQNIKCMGRSITDVILSHPDFNIDSTKIINFIPPTFTIVKGRGRNIVLVLDVSGSMTYIIDNMILAVVQFVENVVEDTAQLGLVIFSDHGQIKSNLLPMGNADSKSQMIRTIKGIVIGGWTNIPDGLRKGVQVLGGDIDNTDEMFGTIFLLSDGENNREKLIWDNMSLINKIISKGLVVNTIAYGLQTDSKFDNLAARSGGKYVYANTALSYTNLMNIFALRSSCESIVNATIKVSEGDKSINLENSTSIINLFYADEFIGQNLFLTIILSQDISKYNITLLSPLGNEYTCVSSEKQGTQTTLTFKIMGKIEVGIYQLKVTRLTTQRRHKRSTTTISTTYIVSAVVDENSTRVINPSGQLSQSQIYVLNDTKTIIAIVDLSTCNIENNERVTTILSITHPDQQVITRGMRDDGLGCDSIDGDQIYSACIYPNDLMKIEYYTMKADVEINSIGRKDVIKRTVDIGSLRVMARQLGITDKINPARIEEINLSIIDKNERVLKIDFFSTGNDGLIGNISRYQMKLVTTNETFIELTKNETPLQMISFTINLFNETSKDPFELSIRGIDESGNEGQWSPVQMFSWHYNEDLSKYNNLSTINGFNSIFIVVWAFFGRLFIAII